MAVPAFTMNDLMEILIVKAGLPRDSVTADHGATVDDVGLDSLARLQLKAEIVRRFGFEVDAERPGLTFGELLGLVNDGLSEHAR
jgi:acyl carrier protein